MNFVIDDHPTGLPIAQAPPCLSLYQPTHRAHPDRQQDPIRFRNLVKALDQSLGEAYPTRERRQLLEPFHALGDNADFWRYTRDGLAVLGAADMFQVYRLQRRVPELAIVADSFHTKPLLRILQSADRYQILGVSRQMTRLFEGNRDALDEVELAADVPKTITDALGEDVTRPDVTVFPLGGATGRALYGGHGSTSDEKQADAERFFRSVDRAILKHHSRPSGLPLILAALPEHHALFRRISQNPYLTDEGIAISPDAVTIEDLQERAWRVVEPYYLGRLASLIEEFQAATSRQLGSGDLAETAEAMVAGRVGTLLIDADREVPGRIDPATGRIDLSELARPDADDILDDLAEMVLAMAGRAIVVPAARMPTKTGVAAISGTESCLELRIPSGPVAVCM